MAEQGVDHTVVGFVPAARTAEPTVAPMDFATWVDDYQRTLLAFAQLVSGDRYTAEDLVQTALARAFLRWAAISAPGQHPLAYVQRIIVNEHTSLWRRAWKRRERTTDAVPDLPAAEADGDDQVWALVQLLPARQRAVIALRFYADLSVAQTAEVLGCSVGSVKTHSSRAMSRLRHVLEKGSLR